MSSPISIAEETLHAYIDGELPENGRAEVESAAARDPDLTGWIALYRADKAQLMQVYGAVAGHPIPLRWIDTIEAGSRNVWRPIPLRTVAALAAALLIAIAGAILYRQFTPQRQSIVEAALAARNGELPARKVFAANSRDHAAAAARLVSSALKMPLKAPDLSRMGYRLTGLRVYDDGAAGKSAELLYRGKNDRLFTLYVRRSSGAVRFDEFKLGDGLRVCIWQDDVLGAVMAGKMSAAEMQRLASLAYTGLES